MSEASNQKVANPKRAGAIIAIGIVAVLALGYFGGSLIVPRLIKSNFQAKNCASVLSLSNTYTTLYSYFKLAGDADQQIRECAVYTLALDNEEKKAWRDAYNAFHVYSQTYPQGLFTVDAHEHGASVLVSLAKEQTGQKQYVEALGNLNLIL